MTPNEIRELRLVLKMTQPDMAHYLNLKHDSQVSHLESGRTPARGPVLRLLSLLRATQGRVRQHVH